MKSEHQRSSRQAAKHALNAMWSMLPLMTGVLLLMSLLTQFLPRLLESGLFGTNAVLDAMVGAVAGGIAAGQPVVSYLLGGELSDAGVGLAGVTALVVAWVTVGVTHMPMESAVFGWRFTLLRNLSAMLSAVVIALIISWVVYGLG